MKPRKLYDTPEERLHAARIRWRRWLGQKRRPDLPFWTDLLQSNFAGWPRKVLGDDYNTATDAWALAISRATIDQLMSLDILNLVNNQERRR
jgi:hypothetical protein